MQEKCIIPDKKEENLLNYSVGSRLRVDGRIFNVVGKIQYQNTTDRCIWHEYRMFSEDDRREYWLSVDDVYREYSISSVTRSMPDANDYHEVDRGVEKVMGRWGDVDVDFGETAQFIEYEDHTEEKIISVEKWSDGTEFSTGYYLDADEIEYIGKTQTTVRSSQSGSDHSGGLSVRINTLISVIFIVVIMLSALNTPVINLLSDLHVPSVSKMLKNDSLNYSYVTSETGSNGNKADVYKSLHGTVDSTATEIIIHLDGKTEDVMQNTEDKDNSIGILTRKEYCFIYESEEGDVLVQVSDRKYVYSTDSQPYRSRSSSHRFYRRHYYSRGYTADSSSFGSKTYNSYSGYSDTSLGSSDSDSFNTYSRTIRQQSISSRQSSGGGTNYGK